MTTAAKWCMYRPDLLKNRLFKNIFLTILDQLYLFGLTLHLKLLFITGIAGIINDRFIHSRAAFLGSVATFVPIIYCSALIFIGVIQKLNSAQLFSKIVEEGPSLLGILLSVRYFCMNTAIKVSFLKTCHFNHSEKAKKYLRDKDFEKYLFKD